MNERIDRLKEAESQNRKRTNCELLVLMLLCIVYIIKPVSFLMLLAVLYLGYILFRLYRQNGMRRVRFLQEEREALRNFESLYGEEKKLAGGYLENHSEFQSIMLLRKEDRILVKPMCIEKHFVCSKNGLFWYLLSARGCDADSCREILLQDVHTEEIEEDHQIFLRKKGQKWEQLMIIEEFVYQRFLHQLVRGSLSGCISMGTEIDHLRREKVYAMELNTGDTLYLPGPTMELLELV